MNGTPETETRDRARGSESPRRLGGALSPAAAAHLAHEFRAALHAILGFAELLELDAPDDQSRDSAARIREAASHLGGICEDVVDALRLPDRGGESMPVPLRVDRHGASAIRAAAERAVRVQVDSPEPVVLVEPEVQRVVTHVIDEIICCARSDVTVRCAQRDDRAWIVIVAPAPETCGGDENGILALGALLLAAGGGGIQLSGRRVELLVPSVRTTDERTDFD